MNLMSQRTEKVAGMLQKEISRALIEDIENSRIGFVTVLRVDVSPDLRVAKVFYSVLGSDDEKKATDIEIKNSSKYIKKLVNDRIAIKYAIDLRFIRESVIDEDFRIEKIFDKIRKEKKPGASTGPETGEKV